jgi:hypothetical protein
MSSEACTKPPAWTFQWCYAFMGVGFATLISGMIAAITMYKQVGPMILIFYALAIAVQLAFLITQFYMCRTSLNPRNESSCVN